MNFLQASLPDKTTPKKHWGQLYGCARSLVINDAIEQHDGLVVVLTPDSLSCSQIFNEVRFFHQDNADFISFPEKSGDTRSCLRYQTFLRKWGDDISMQPGAI